MDTIVIIILLLFAIAVSATVFYILTFNKLQRFMVRIQEAEASIDESLRNRYDILVKMETLINEIVELNQKNFSSFKADSMTNFEVDRKLTKIENTFSKIKFDYSDELDVEDYRNLLVELKMENEKCDAAKSFYNKYTTDLNMLIKKFPTNVIGKLHGITERNYFDNKNMNDEDITDFKI